MKPNLVNCCLVVLAASLPIFASADGAATDADTAARRFVQQFYDWYLPKALSSDGGRTTDLALESKSAAFAPRLLRALKDDSAAQAKVKGDIVGLDFDPFLNSQDPCEGYAVGNVNQHGGSFLAEIYAVCSGKKEQQPAVVAELVSANGHWQFTNFRYAEGDLLSVLSALRVERTKGLNPARPGAAADIPPAAPRR